MLCNACNTSVTHLGVSVSSAKKCLIECDINFTCEKKKFFLRLKCQIST